MLFTVDWSLVHRLFLLLFNTFFLKHKCILGLVCRPRLSLECNCEPLFIDLAHRLRLLRDHEY